MNYEILIPDRPIAFNRDFIRLGLSTNCALFLSQGRYWSNRTDDEDGWFYKTVAEWEEETGLTRDEQLTVKKKLTEKGYLSVSLRGIPAKNHFLFHWRKVADDLLSTTSSRKPRQLDVGNDDNIHNTKSTTYTIPDGKSEDFRIVEEPETKKPRKRVDTHILDVFRLVGGSKYPKPWERIPAYRESADWLFSEKGTEQIAKAIKIIREHKGTPDLPTIHTPYDLFTKWEKLIDFKERHSL